jgi:two-component sensor histidine kinase
MRVLPKNAGRAAVKRWRLQPADLVVGSSVALVVIIFAFFGFLVWQAYFQVLEGAKEKAQRAADIVAQETAWIAGAGVTLLNQFAELSSDASTIPNAAGLLEQLPAEAGLGVYAADGTAAAGDVSDPVLPASIAAAPFFAELQGGEMLRIAALEDQKRFAIARRLEVAGQFAGAAVLFVDAKVLERLWAPLDLGPGSTVSIVGTDGWVVARYPALEQPVSLVGQAGFAQTESQESGVYESPRSPVDGLSRLVAFQKVSGLELIGYASVSQQAVLDSLWSSAITVLWLMGPIAAALLLGSFLTARVLRQNARTQQNLAAALAHNEVLFREIHHRVKNNLQSVAALFSLQPIPREIKTEMGQRIAAMSAVHEHIYRSNEFSTVRLKEYLQALIESIRAGHDPRVEFALKLADISVNTDTAGHLGLILNEVLSNAYKHAFADGRAGLIKITLTQESDELGLLTVEDNGLGYDTESPAKGIGQRLIKGLSGQVGGEAKFQSGESGSRFTLTFAVTNPDA